jgi:hypothetical protein
MSQWEQQWDVPGSTGRIYKVSRDYSGNYACSCPQWIYKRDDCKHIKAVRIFENLSNITGRLPSGELIRPNLPKKELALIGQVTRKFNFE